MCCSLLSSTSKMGRSGELSDFECGLVIGCHISKKSFRDIAPLLKLPKSAVGDVIVNCKREGTTTMKPRLGRPHLMTDRDHWALKKVVRETRQTSSEIITCEFRSAMNCPASVTTVRWELRGMGFHGQAAAHKPNISPVNTKRRLKWRKEWRQWTEDNWNRVIWSDESCYTMWQSNGRFGCGKCLENDTSQMCSAKCKIWRRWHYSVGVFFMEWTWPSRNTAQKYKHGRIQGHSDPMHTVYGRRPVWWWRLSVSAWQCSLP
jgi:hypothetical protein